jgi:hypothetical protein
MTCLVLPDVRFDHEDAIPGEHIVALAERHHTRDDSFIGTMSSAYRAPQISSVAG